MEEIVFEIPKEDPVEKFLVGVSQAKHKLYKPVLETQLKNPCSPITSYGEKHKKDMSSYTNALTTTTKRTLDKLENISGLVGFQPMTGPVGLVYSLQYRYLEDKDLIEDTAEELDIINNDGNVITTLFPAKKKENALEGAGGRMLGLEVVSQAVEAGSRTLPFGWSLTETPNQNAIEKTSEKVAESITSEIISDLRALAIKEEYESLSADKTFLIIQRAMNNIARNTRRGVGNKVIVSPDIWEKIETLIDSEYKLITTFEPVADIGQPEFLIRKGIVNKTATYYVQKDAPKGTVLVAYKGGNGDTDTSYMYCPYVLLMLVSTQKEHDAAAAHFYTRYGKIVTGNSYPDTLCEGKHYYRELTFK